MNDGPVREAVAAAVSSGVVQVRPEDVEIAVLGEIDGITLVRAVWSYEDMREAEPAALTSDGAVVLDRAQILDMVFGAWEGCDPPTDPVEQAKIVTSIVGNGKRERVVADADAARRVEEFLAADRAAKPGVRLSVPIQAPVFVDGALVFWLDHDYGPTRVTVSRGDNGVDVAREDAERFGAG